MISLFTNGIIFVGKDFSNIYSSMLIEDGIIKALYKENDKLPKIKNTINLNKQYVYPCLIDGHIHMLLTIAQMAIGFNICEIKTDDIFPNTIKGIEQRIKEYVKIHNKDKIIACNNYITSAIKERRMPYKDELDKWSNNKAVVIYNIDGHSTSLSSKMLEMIGIDPKNHNGILSGEENERAQGRIIDKISSLITPSVLAKGIAKFQNTCAKYGISCVGALEGNGDSKKDITTKIIAYLARGFDIDVKLYLQYKDLSRVKPFEKYLSNPRVGGCGDFEMDGSIGSHSAAFSLPFKDTKTINDCYYQQNEIDKLIKKANDLQYQIASHAIGDMASDRLVKAYKKIKTNRLNRIEHAEFLTTNSLQEIIDNNWALVMQPGYSWIDKRYLHTYSQYLEKSLINGMYLKTLIDNNVCVCGSSDSPVQDINPYLQMLGMIEFYKSEESISIKQAFKTYTYNAARAIESEDICGSIDIGKYADFFISVHNLFDLDSKEITNFKIKETYYKGIKYQNKKGTIFELIKIIIKKKKLI